MIKGKIKVYNHKTNETIFVHSSDLLIWLDEVDDIFSFKEVKE